MVNQLLVKEDYKETELGWIPKDWEIVSLENSSTLNARIGWQGLTTNEYLELGNIKLVSGTNFKDGKVNWKSCFYVDEKRFKQDVKIQLRNSDILVTKDGTIGKVAYVSNLIAQATLNSGVFVLRPKKNNYLPKFFFYVFSSKYFRDFIDKLTAGSTIVHLYQKDFVKFLLPKPKYEEQQAIASVLSDMDELIESLEEVIDKKKKIKQGTMQQLLTGKKRLPGFTDKWKTEKFKDVTDLITCGIASTPKYVDASQGVPFLSSTNIKSGKIDWKNYKYIPKELHKRLYLNNPPVKGDILYSRVGSIGEAAVIETDFEFSIYVSLTLIKPKKELYNIYLKQLLNSEEFKTKAKNTVLMGGGVGNLNVGVVREYLIPLPDIKEQEAIAKILSDMDAEIELLEEKLEKYEQMKEGMMQQLLTGRIRLV